MYELEKYLADLLNSILAGLKAFFDKVALYLLVIVIALVTLMIIYLIIKSLFNRQHYIDRGKKGDKTVDN